MDGWIWNGVAILAVSNEPAGPFACHDVALPVVQHNPHAIKHPDGHYLLFGIGQANNASWQCTCVDGKPMVNGWPATDTDAAPLNHTQQHVSKSPYGPWENVPGPDGRDYIFATNYANPAPYIFQNGSLIMISESTNNTRVVGVDSLCTIDAMQLLILLSSTALRHYVHRSLPWPVQKDRAAALAR